MAQLLNKFVFSILFFCQTIAFAQTSSDDVLRPKDYKDEGQFKHYYRRRQEVSKWQINQLKNGALVVRLHTNKKLIEGLRKMGKADLATEKEYEQMAINKNIMLAFQKYYTFSKVYFFFSQDSDSLFKGKRKGFFVDTNLTVNPDIEMQESFYLLAERDGVYNSSIGYVKEDTAKFVKETGVISYYDASMVLKNKYGHQLKDPFPFFVTNKSTINGTKMVTIKVGNNLVPVALEKPERIERHYIYVTKLNKQLNSFYTQNAGYKVTDPEIQPFLY